MRNQVAGIVFQALYEMIRSRRDYGWEWDIIEMDWLAKVLQWLSFQTDELSGLWDKENDFITHYTIATIITQCTYQNGLPCHAIDMGIERQFSQVLLVIIRRNIGVVEEIILLRSIAGNGNVVNKGVI